MCCLSHLTILFVQHLSHLVCPFLHAAPFCKSLIQGLESNPLSRIVWRGIKPLFIGKLLYTPDSPAVRQVMNEVQSNLRESILFLVKMYCIRNCIMKQILLTTSCVCWRWTRLSRTCRSFRSWMKPGWRWDHKSRITWRVVWRFSYCRSDSPATISLQGGMSVLWYIWTQKSFFFHILLVCVWQDLLKRPEVAVLVNLRLENTSWTASRIARFLSTPSPDAPRKSGAPSTWLDVYNDLSHTITTLAQVTEVRSLCPSWFLFMLLSKHVRFFSLLLRIRTEHIMFDEIGDGNKNCTQFSRNRGKWFCLLQCQMLNCTYSF